jgi:hypothetical protein
MKKCLFTTLIFVICFTVKGQYQYNFTGHVSAAKSFGLQFVKHNAAWGSHIGIGITTFFNRGAVGKDYTNFYNPAFAYEVRTEYSGSMYATLIHKWFGVRLGFGAKKHYYNGITNGEYWYVTRDGGTYLLYGVSLNKLDLTKRINFAAAYDNVNGLSLGLGISFNEGK